MPLEMSVRLVENLPIANCLQLPVTLVSLDIHVPLVHH
jgi:hypothetical protein